MVTDLKKRQALELGSKLHRAWFVRKKVLSQYLRWQMTVATTSQQSKWLHVCSRDYHDVTSLPTNSYVPAWLSVNHWWYQLLSQSWVAWVWCLWTLTQRLMADSTMMNCCWNDCCQRSANYPILLFVHWQSWAVVLQSKVCTHETGVVVYKVYILLPVVWGIFLVNIIQIGQGSMGLLLK